MRASAIQFFAHFENAEFHKNFDKNTKIGVQKKGKEAASELVQTATDPEQTDIVAPTLVRLPDLVDDFISRMPLVPAMT